MANQVDVYRRVDSVMQVLEDRTVPGILYIGLTPLFTTLKTEAQWQIQRTTFDIDGQMVTAFANLSKYNCVWDDRHSYFDAPPATTQPFPGEAIDVGNVTITNATVAVIANAMADSAQLDVSVSTEAKVGATRMVGRKLIEIQPIDGKVWYSFKTPATLLNSTPLEQDQHISFPIGDMIGIFLIADSGTVKVAVNEIA